MNAGRSSGLRLVMTLPSTTTSRSTYLSRSVLGEYQPTKGRKGTEPDGDPVPDYYPAVVTMTAWSMAHASQAQRGTGRGERAPRSKQVLSGLLTRR
jgi:hypothetical protein